MELRRRIALELWRRIRQRQLRQPQLRQLFWECTQRCNLACLHCGSDCKQQSAVPDMPAQDFLHVIDSITPHVDPHKVMIIITGGEPLLRKDLAQVGLELYRREYPWGIVSNGLAMTPSRFDELRRGGLHAVTISLDGLSDDHNWMRGHHQSFDRALSAIRMVAQATDIASDVVTCVNQRNIEHLDQLKETLIDAGVKSWRLFTIFPMGRAAEHPELHLDASQFRYLMEYIKATRAEGRIGASYCCEGFLGEYEGEVRDHFFTCQSGVSVASIRVDGAISGCLSVRGDYDQGNIYSDDFMEVWRSRFAKHRDHSWMRAGQCADCDAWRYCQGNGMHLRATDGTLICCNYQKISTNY